MMSNESLSSSGNSRVPRPIICLNIAIDPTGRNSTMLRTVGRSTPVDSICEVVAMTGSVRLGVGEVAEVAPADLALVAHDAHDVVRGAAW